MKTIRYVIALWLTWATIEGHPTCPAGETAPGNPSEAIEWLAIPHQLNEHEYREFSRIEFGTSRNGDEQVAFMPSRQSGNLVICRPSRRTYAEYAGPSNTDFDDRIIVTTSDKMASAPRCVLSKSLQSTVNTLKKLYPNFESDMRIYASGDGILLLAAAGGDTVNSSVILAQSDFALTKLEPLGRTLVTDQTGWDHLWCVGWSAEHATLFCPGQGPTSIMPATSVLKRVQGLPISFSAESNGWGIQRVIPASDGKRIVYAFDLGYAYYDGSRWRTAKYKTLDSVDHGTIVGDKLLLSDEYCICIYDLNNGSEIQHLPMRTLGLSSSRSGERIVVNAVGPGGNVLPEVYQLNGNELKRIASGYALGGQLPEIHAATISPDGRWIGFVGRDSNQEGVPTMTGRIRVESLLLSSKSAPPTVGRPFQYLQLDSIPFEEQPTEPARSLLGKVKAKYHARLTADGRWLFTGVDGLVNTITGKKYPLVPDYYFEFSDTSDFAILQEYDRLQLWNITGDAPLLQATLDLEKDHELPAEKRLQVHDLFRDVFSVFRLSDTQFAIVNNHAVVTFQINNEEIRVVGYQELLCTDAFFDKSTNALCVLRTRDNSYLEFITYQWKGNNWVGQSKQPVATSQQSFSFARFLRKGPEPLVVLSMSHYGSRPQVVDLAAPDNPVNLTMKIETGQTSYATGTGRIVTVDQANRTIITLDPSLNAVSKIAIEFNVEGLLVSSDAKVILARKRNNNEATDALVYMVEEELATGIDSSKSTEVNTVPQTIDPHESDDAENVLDDELAANLESMSKLQEKIDGFMKEATKEYCAIYEAAAAKGRALNQDELRQADELARQIQADFAKLLESEQ